MTKKLMTIGALVVVLAVASCRSPERNPDDRFAQGSVAQLQR